MLWSLSAIARGIAGYKAIDVNPQAILPAMSAYQTWKQNALSDYTFMLYTECQCELNGVTQVYVINNHVIKVTDESGWIKNIKPKIRSSLTMDQLLDLIERYSGQMPDRMSWHLNRTLGYPESIIIDPAYRTGDDEINYKIDHFQLLMHDPLSSALPMHNVQTGSPEKHQ